MKNILITGTAGFVGFHLVKQLAKHNFNCVGIDNINDYYEVSLKHGRLKEAGIDVDKLSYGVPQQSSNNANYVFYQLDLQDKDNIFKLFEEHKFDYVINLAAQAGVRYSLQNPYAYVDSNIKGFLNLLEASRYNNVKHMVYASSSSVYGGNEKIPFEESDRVDSPVSLYAATKKANELFAHTYTHLYKFSTTGLRFFTVYGAWGRPDMAYYSFAKNIVDGDAIKIFNNGDMERDFTYIDDITEAIARLIEGFEKDDATKPTSQIYNIGNSSPVRLLDFIETLEKVIGTEAKKEFLPMQPGDVVRTFADTSRLESKVGPLKGTTLAEGLEVFGRWFKQYYQPGK